MNTKLKSAENWFELAQQANWSVSNLARLCNVSRRTLYRHFLYGFKKSPKAWMAEQRHQKQAIEHLSNGLSVKEAALLLGYQHASTFAREFKKVCGDYPSTVTLTTSMPQSNGS